MSAIRLEKTSTVDALVNLLTGRIHAGVYPPGSKLPSERQLQEEFGVGRLALREALSRLNAVGLIDTAHGKGTFVLDDVKSSTLRNVLIPYFALNNSRRLKDFVEARAMVESEIAGLAAQQRSSRQLTRLEEIINQPFTASASHEEVAEQDLRFHRELALMIDNQFLVIMHKALISHIRAFLLEFVKAKASPVEVMAAHRPIFEAVRDGRAADARDLARLHISFSMQDYEHFVQRNYQPGK